MATSDLEVDRTSREQVRIAPEATARADMIGSTR